MYLSNLRCVCIDARLERTGRASRAAPLRQNSSIGEHAPSACIVLIGDELLSGKVTDANLQFLASELHALGWKVLKVSILGDDIDSIARYVMPHDETLSFSAYVLQLREFAEYYSGLSVGCFSPENLSRVLVPCTTTGTRPQTPSIASRACKLKMYHMHLLLSLLEAFEGWALGFLIQTTMSSRHKLALL